MLINKLLKRISDLEFEVERQDKEIERLNEMIETTIKRINYVIRPNNDYIEYDFGAELFAQELLDILNGDKEFIQILKEFDKE